MIIKVETENPQRLDKFLTEFDEFYSRNFIDSLINQKLILVDGKNVKKSHKVCTGEVIEIQLPPSKKIELAGEDIPIEVLYEDEYLAIINKQANLTVHPAPGNLSGTLLNGLIYKFGNKLSVNDPTRPGIVHRLDKDTTGVMVIAKDDSTHSQLASMFAARDIKMTYEAIIVGTPQTPSGTIDEAVARSKNDRKKMTVAPDGRRAVTHWQVLDYYDFFSHVSIDLETGRTHQIRVHFSHINHPVLGDDTYNTYHRSSAIIPVHMRKKLKFLLANHLRRQALHAKKIEFTHPQTKQTIAVEAPLPADFSYTIAWLNEHFKVI